MILLGRISLIESDFVSILGQSVFLDQIGSRFGIGDIVAVYGSIDIDTGGIVGATMVSARDAGFRASTASYLTGLVDSVDYSTGKALVSGLMVDYNALSATGWAPRVGDQVSVTGYHYGSLGLLVADPQLRLERR